MSIHPSQYVFVDDDDPSITYNGPWETNSTALIDPPGGGGGGGHDAVGTARSWRELYDSGSVTFLFGGTKFWIQGQSPDYSRVNVTTTSSPGEQETNERSVPNMEWDCFIDGLPIAKIYNLTDNTIGGAFGRVCWGETSSLTPSATQTSVNGLHNVTIAARSLRRQRDTFLGIDGLFYVPVAPKNGTGGGGDGNEDGEEGKPRWVRHSLDENIETDAIEYDVVPWDSFSASDGDARGLTTEEDGTTMTFKYTGTSVSMVGWKKLGSTFDQTNISTYQIDDGPAIQFQVPFTPSERGFDYRARPYTFFESQNAPPGRHTLVVTYRGLKTSRERTPAPLLFEYFLVRQTPSLSLGVDGGGSSASTNRPGPSGTNKGEGGSDAGAKKKPPIGAIVGAVIAVVVVLFAVVAFLWRRKCQRDAERKRRRKESLFNSPISPYDTSRHHVGLGTDVEGGGASLSSAQYSSKSAELVVVPHGNDSSGAPRFPPTLATLSPTSNGVLSPTSPEATTPNPQGVIQIQSQPSPNALSSPTTSTTSSGTAAQPQTPAPAPVRSEKVRLSWRQPAAALAGEGASPVATGTGTESNSINLTAPGTSQAQGDSQVVASDGAAVHTFMTVSQDSQPPPPYTTV